MSENFSISMQCTQNENEIKCLPLPAKYLRSYICEHAVCCKTNFTKFNWYTVHIFGYIVSKMWVKSLRIDDKLLFMTFRCFESVRQQFYCVKVLGATQFTTHFFFFFCCYYYYLQPYGVSVCSAPLLMYLELDNFYGFM